MSNYMLLAGLWGAAGVLLAMLVLRRRKRKWKQYSYLKDPM